MRFQIMSDLHRNSRAGRTTLTLALRTHLRMSMRQAAINPDDLYSDATRFLLHCVRPRPDACELARLATGVDWEAVFALASSHDVLPLVYAGISAACHSWVPQPLLAGARDAMARNTRDNLRFTAELLQLLESFERAGIRVMPFKGPILAWSVYRSPGLRTFLDLDLLVHRQDMTASRQLLLEHGFTDGLDRLPESLDWNEQFPLENPQSGVSVDLHWRPLPAHMSSLDAGYFWSDAIALPIAGRQVTAFAPEKTFIYLCLHGAKHGWKSLKWLCDMAHLADRFALDWERILADAGHRHVSRAVLLGVALACDVLGASAPDCVDLSGIRRSRSYARAVRHLFHGWPRATRFREMLFQLPLIESLGDKWRLWRSMIEPTPLDFGVVGLPASCSSLYYPVRMLRLAAGGLVAFGTRR